MDLILTFFVCFEPESRGLRSNSANLTGCNVLHAAVALNRLEIVRFLLEEEPV